MSKVKTVFFPGENWVYFKLYTSFLTSDSILVSEIDFIVKKLYKYGIIRQFFFIRYSDPDYHLRIRFLIIDNREIGEVISIFYKSLNRAICDHKVWKIQLDTYMREVNRYHPMLVNYAEEYFCIDSKRIIKLIKKLIAQKQDNLRWAIALYLIDNFLNNMKCSMPIKLNIMSELSANFKNEFGFNEFNSKQFNTKYRVNKNMIEAALSHNTQDVKLHELMEIANLYSQEIVSLFDKIISTTTKKRIDLKTFIISCIHMTVNRLFRTQNRLYELLIYDFMRRYYSSSIARNNALSKA